MYEQLIDQLRRDTLLSKEAYKLLIENRQACAGYLFENARQVRDSVYGRNVFIRGLIEISNRCKNDCFYCGIRRSNGSVSRYRLYETEILESARKGYALGFRTFVLQGGEDAYYTDEVLCGIIQKIKALCPGCAVTLSLGERSFESYKRLKDAGADRYLLRHETANSAHYGKLHPPQMRFENRLRCLKDLKSLGYQTGAGFMVGSPFQTIDDLAGEFAFLKELQPEMVGIGPFVPHRDTPFRSCSGGSAELTLFMLALIRLTLPHVLLPATTALATVDGNGHVNGMNAGANVIMPNLTPENEREKYTLYNNKAHTGAEAAEGLALLKAQMRAAGYEIVSSRGDYMPRNAVKNDLTIKERQ